MDAGLRPTRPMTPALRRSALVAAAAGGWWQVRQRQSRAVQSWRPSTVPGRRGGPLHVRAAGSGDDTVVLLHGLVATAISSATTSISSPQMRAWWCQISSASPDLSTRNGPASVPMTTSTRSRQPCANLVSQTGRFGSAPTRPNRRPRLRSHTPPRRDTHCSRCWASPPHDSPGLMPRTPRQG